MKQMILLIAVFLILPISSSIAQTQQTHSVYLPVIWRDYGSDPRYVAWRGPVAEVKSVGLRQQNTALNCCACAECSNQWVWNCDSAARFASQHLGKLYIIGDEPDQHNQNPADYLDWYNECYALIKSADPTARVALAGIAQPNPRPCDRGHGLTYLNALWEASGGRLQTDQLRVHAFASLGELDNWKRYIESWMAWRDQHMPGTPLALGTFGYPGSPEASPQVLRDTRAALEWLESTELEQWYWWSWSRLGCTNRLWDGEKLTPVGEIWVNGCRH